jgi:DNA-binding GntR family transcriptional regulator
VTDAAPPGNSEDAVRAIGAPQWMLTAQQLAYRHIRDAILDGDLRGGMSLKAQPIAEQLGISRMPVREALRQLDVEGLVTLRQNRTAVVTELSICEIGDLFDMRAALEAMTSSAIAPRITDEVLANLERLCTAMNEVSGDARKWIPRHVEFHDYLSRLSGRQRLSAEIEQIRRTIQPYLRLYIDAHGNAKLPDFEHGTLLTAIGTRDAVLIGVSLKEHVLTAGRGVIAFLARRQAERNELSARGGARQRAA